MIQVSPSPLAAPIQSPGSVQIFSSTIVGTDSNGVPFTSVIHATKTEPGPAMSAPSAFKFSFTTFGTDSKSVAFTSVLSCLFTPRVPQPSGQVLPQFPFTAVGTDSTGVPTFSQHCLLLFQEVFHRVFLQAELEPVLLVGFQSLLLLRLTLQLARRSRSASIQPWQQTNNLQPIPRMLALGRSNYSSKRNKSDLFSNTVLGMPWHHRKADLHEIPRLLDRPR